MAERLDRAVRLALAGAGSNKLQAQKELARLALADDQLLKELVAPFLKPIVAQVVERAVRETSSPARAPLPGLSKSLAGMGDMTAGYNPMQAALAATDAPKRPDASARHVSTLKLLAAAYAVKRGERV